MRLIGSGIRGRISRIAGGVRGGGSGANSLGTDAAEVVGGVGAWAEDAGGVRGGDGESGGASDARGDAADPVQCAEAWADGEDGDVFPGAAREVSVLRGVRCGPGLVFEAAACSKQTILFMQHHAAFEQRNPKHLNGLYADLQAALFSLLQQILQTIIADGVKVEAPKYYTDKDGNMILAEYYTEAGEKRTIMDIQAHPLFKPLGELLSRNNLSLADMGMTQKVIDDEEQEFGRLQSQEQSREALTEYSRRQAKALEDLQGLMAQASARRDTDPILIDYVQQNGGQG
jgi:hypothetical protein